MADTVVATKTEPRCKFCISEHRSEIDQLLYLRSKHAKDQVTGQRINGDYVLAALRGFGIANPTLDNCKSHWGKHCEVVPEGMPERQAEERQRVRETEHGPLDLDATLDRIIREGVSDLDVRILETGKSGITIDQVLKAAQVKTQRRENDAVRGLLGAAIGAIGGAFQKRDAIEPPKHDLELPAGDIEEAEVVDA